MQTQKLTANDIIMHHGVKGMKWGVRRARNALALKAAKESENSVYNHTNKYKGVTNDEKFAAKVGGTTGNRIRMAASKSISNKAGQNRRMIDNTINNETFNGNRHLSNIQARNAKHIDKLTRKANGPKATAKDRENLKVFKAYSKEIDKRVNDQRSSLNKEYAKSQQARNDTFKPRKEYLDNIEKYIYGNSNPKRPNINQIDNDNFQAYQKATNTVKQEVKKQQNQNKQKKKGGSK